MAEELLVFFELEGNVYALDISTVREILKVPTIIPLPEMPHYIEGVVHIRDKVVPVLNLRTRLGLQKVDTDQHARIILVNSPKGLYALIVDRVLEVSGYSREKIEVLDAMDVDRGPLRGILKKPDFICMILDIERIA